MQDDVGQPIEERAEGTNREDQVMQQGKPSRPSDERMADADAEPASAGGVFGGGAEDEGDPYDAHNPETRATEQRALDEFIEHARG